MYLLIAAKERVVSRSDSPDERIRSLARIGGVVFLALVCWESFDYFFRGRESAAGLLVLAGVLAGFQLAAELHWHVSVGRHLRRNK